jgi:hypothetical protein
MDILNCFFVCLNGQINFDFLHYMYYNPFMIIIHVIRITFIYLMYALIGANRFVYHAVS